MQQVAHRGAWLPHYPHSVWVTCLSLTAHCCCWFISCTSMIQTTTPPHPKGALVEWHMLIVEVNLVQWTQWHVCDTAAGSTMEQFGHTSMDMTSNNSQVDCGTGTMLSWYRRVQSLHHQQSEPGRMDPHFPVVHAVAWPYPLNVTTEINQWNLYFEPFCVLIHNKK